MMKYHNMIPGLVLVPFLALTQAAGAATLDQTDVASEVNSCVAAVRENVDYVDATRIRHDITAIERRTVGYTLKISTSLYGETEERPIRAYAATCIVNGDNPPLRFTMERGR